MERHMPQRQSEGRNTTGAGRVLALVFCCIASAGILAACGNNSKQLNTTPYLYTANSGDNTISAFAVASSGKLSTATCQDCSYPRIDQPYGLVMNPTGAFLYTSDHSGTVGVLAFDTVYETVAVGSLAVRTNLPVGSSPDGVAVSPNGDYLYVTNYGSNTISAFAGGADGNIASTPVSCSACSNTSYFSAPTGVAVSPNGKYVYVANSASNTVSAFTIGSGGALSFTGSYNTGASPERIAISPDGNYLYVTNTYNSVDSVSGFIIGSNGTLSEVSGSACRPSSASNCFATGSDPFGIVVGHNSSVLYVANSGSSGAHGISAFSIGSGGVLTSDGTYATGSQPHGIAIAPSGDSLYVTNYGSNSVSAFSIGSGGGLTSIATYATGSKPIGIAIGTPP